MAYIKQRFRKDGTPYWQVRFMLDGKQSAQTFTAANGPGAEREAEKFCTLINSLDGDARRALEIWGIPLHEPGRAGGPTLAEWLDTYLTHKTGLERKTRVEYGRYMDRDINPVLGEIPLTQLNEADVSKWINAMEKAGSSGKTIANKHGFLSEALTAAVKRGEMPSNPCRGMKMPRTVRREMVFLSEDQYRKLHSCFSDYYKPLVEFLVVSGARFSEVAALTPADVDRKAHTVRIWRAWKLDPANSVWELGMPKTRESIRTIDVDPAVLDGLDYSRDWLFVNKAGNPVRIYGWRENVWYPAVRKSGLDPRPRVHDLRHTCASWMIADGTPLPVIQHHLGHESIETTVKVYGRLDRRVSKVAAAGIAKRLGLSSASSQDGGTPT